MEQEIWKDIPEYEGLYQVSSFGRVKSLHRKSITSGGWCQSIHGKILKPQKCSNGYLFFPLCKNNKVHQILAHRLVMKTFVGESELEVNHKDGNKENNYLLNLEYTTHHKNQLHSYRVLHREPVRSWLGKRGASHNKSIGVRVIDTKTGEYLDFGSYRLADENGFNRQYIRNMIGSNQLYKERYKFERL